MFQRRGTCGRCGQVVDFGFVHVSQYAAEDILPVERRPGFHIRAAFSEDDEGPEVTGYGTALCPLCASPSFFLFKTKQRWLRNISAAIGSSEGLFGGGNLITVVEVLPAPARAQVDPHWPPEIHQSFREAQELLQQGISAAIVITVCRSVMEVSLGKLGANGRNLHDRINDLKARGIITNGIAEWAHATRLEGNQAVHEIAGTPEQAREIVEFIRTFLDVAFALPASIAARKARAGQA